MDGMKNQQYAKEAVLFLVACQLAGVEPTPRQASKFRNDRRGRSRLQRRAAMCKLLDQAYEEVGA
jgi:uncharacterized protein HemY